MPQSRKSASRSDKPRRDDRPAHTARANDVQTGEESNKQKSGPDPSYAEQQAKLADEGRGGAPDNRED